MADNAAPPTTTDRWNVNLSLSRNWEFLRNRYIGTGHPDTTREQWATQIHRDSHAGGVGHLDQLAFFALASNQSVMRTRNELLDRMVRPFEAPRPGASEEEESPSRTNAGDGRN